MAVKKKMLIFGSVVIVIILLISLAILNQINYKNRVKENILNLDSIQYLSIDSSFHSITSSDKYKVIFFFKSECDHCQNEAKLISANASSFLNTDIYFFSTEELPPIKEFARKFGLSKKPDFGIGRVDSRQVAHKMGVNTYPMCFIYSRDGSLLKKYVGEVKIEALFRYLR